MKRFFSFLAALSLSLLLNAQGFQQMNNPLDNNGMGMNNNTTNRNFNKHNNDTTKNKEIPKGLRVWTIDRRFGDVTPAKPE